VGRGEAARHPVLAVCPGATDTEFFDTAGESAAVGKKRSADQVVERTIRELSSSKPSFVDGPANVIAARLLNRSPLAGC
jgi:short-subunit dehydrogenase